MDMYHHLINHSISTHITVVVTLSLLPDIQILQQYLLAIYGRRYSETISIKMLMGGKCSLAVSESLRQDIRNGADRLRG